jgi:hypothetical protein
MAFFSFELRVLKGCAQARCETECSWQAVTVKLRGVEEGANRNCHSRDERKS